MAAAVAVLEAAEEMVLDSFPLLLGNGGGTYHLLRRVFPCRFCSKKNRICYIKDCVRTYEE